jgi:prepilin-type N-terminal cleavage/methylation domain-containing protein
MKALGPFRRVAEGHSWWASGFSLIEVVAAITVFAIGIFSVLGLFGPLARSGTDMSDAAVAARLGDLLRVKLRAYVDRAGSLEPVATLLKDSAAMPSDGSIDPRVDKRLLFASRDGSKLGPYNDEIWSGATDAEKFFLITLFRNQDISPSLPDDPDQLVVVYAAAIRWPAFFATGIGAHGSSSVSRRHQQTLWLPGAIVR